MAKYSIRHLEEISGIKAHTIRTWEKRYNMFSPTRSSTNIRTYTDEELKKLLNISILLKSGIKISKIAALSDQEIYDIILHSSQATDDYEVQIKNLMVSALDFDEEKFEKILSKCIMQIGFESTFISILYPLFYRIGLLWQTCKITPAQEHFVSNLVRQKLIVAIDSTMVKETNSTRKFLLFLPDNEYHELGLLFYYYLLKKNNHKVVYLGQSIPLEDVAGISKVNSIDYLFTAITACNDINHLKSFLNKLTKQFPDKKIFIAGQQSKNIPPTYKNIISMTHPSLIINHLSNISNSATS